MRFRIFLASLIIIIFSFFFFPAFNLNPVQAQSCPYCNNPYTPAASTCNACYQSALIPQGAYTLATCLDFNFSQCNGTQAQYFYDSHVVKIDWGTSGPNKICSVPYHWYIPNVSFDIAMTTNVLNNNACYTTFGGIPPGCNQGLPPVLDCSNPPGGSITPTPSPILGAGTYGTGPLCPGPYLGVLCENIPCGYRDDCLCSPCGSSCPPSCPTPTQTPTPSPFCTLSCAGKDGGSVGGGSGSVGSGAGGPTPTPFEPPQSLGNITYQGFNNFVCGLFKDGLGFDGACPDNLPANTFAYPVRYHMLCGGSAYTYQSKVDSASGGSGGFPQPTPTRGPTPTTSLYPPNCNINPSPFPSPTGIVGDPGGGSGNANFCSCSVTLGCQTQLYPVTSASCSASCDMVFLPDNPVYNEPVGIAITGSPSSIDFDDGTTPIPNPAPSIAHTWLNAGVYKTTLTCGAQACQKDFNVYCSYIPKLWYKMKDTSFHKFGGIQNVIPTTILPFDADDNSDRQLDIVQGGVVTAGGDINVGTGTVSIREWALDTYTYSNRWTPSIFLEYAKGRKNYTTVVDSGTIGTITGSEITKDAINIAPPGNFILDSASIQSKSPFTLIIQGDATITGEINPPEKSLAIVVTGKLNVEANVDTISGIFIAQSLDLASDIPIGQTTSTTLKVNGNLISMTAADLSKRKDDDIRKPSIFIVNKPDMYVDLLPYLSTRNYNYQELTP